MISSYIIQNGLRNTFRGKISSNKYLYRSYSSKESPRSWRVLFFGSGDVALASVKFLHSRKDIVTRFDLVCPPQKDSKIPLPTLKFAKQAGITVHTYQPPPKSLMKSLPLEKQSDPSTLPLIQKLYIDCQENLCSIAKSGDFDIGIVVDFGYLLPSSLLSSFPHTPILMHPSLLPKYRGPAPIAHAIINGETETGVTVLDVHPSNFDAGKILHCKTYQIHPDSPGPIIRSELATLGAHALAEYLENYGEFVKNAVEQPLTPPSKAPKLKPSDYYAKFDTETSEQLYNRNKALGPLTTTLFGCVGINITQENGGIHVLIHKIERRLEFHQHSPKLPSDASIGTIIFDKHRKVIWIKSKNMEENTNDANEERDWVAVSSLQFENGQRILDAVSFANGIRFKSNPTQYFSNEPR